MNLVFILKILIFIMLVIIAALLFINRGAENQSKVRLAFILLLILFILSLLMF